MPPLADASPMMKANVSEAESIASPISPVQTKVKLTFEQVIALQHNTGYWAWDKLSSFTCFFKDGATEDASVRQALEGLSGELTDSEMDKMYVTLLAIYVLTEVFAEKED